MRFNALIGRNNHSKINSTVGFRVGVLRRRKATCRSNKRKLTAIVYENKYYK